MKHNNQLLGYVILIAGFALIFGGFFLFIPEENRNNIFWLDLAVVCIVFLVNYVNIFGLFGFFLDFNKNIGGLGFRIAFIPTYNILAITIILVGYFLDIEFKYQLYIQLIAVFLLLIIFFFVQLSSGKVASVAIEEEKLRIGKNEIVKVISQFDIFFSGNSSKWSAEKIRIDSLKETVRYLSPSNNPSALEIDSEIANSLRKAYDFINEKNESHSEFFLLLNKCDELIKLRKNTYSN